MHMKYIILPVIIVIIIMTTSCMKEYTCECTEYNAWTNEPINSYSRSGKMTKDKTESWCKTESYNFASIVKCDLK